MLQPARPATVPATRSAAQPGQAPERHGGHHAARSSLASRAHPAPCARWRRTQTPMPARHRCSPQASPDPIQMITGNAARHLVARPQGRYVPNVNYTMRYRPVAESSAPGATLSGLERNVGAPTLYGDDLPALA